MFGGDLTFSSIAFRISLILGFLSLGALGGVTHYLVAPLLNLKFPPFDSWHGDWVWPVAIVVSFLWPIGFLFSERVYDFFIKYNIPHFLNYLIYIFVLWLWILVIWYFLLSIKFRNS